MKPYAKMDCLIAALAGAVFFGSTSVAVGQDWPQWRGPERSGKSTDFKAPKEWPKELTQKWKVAVGQGDATPALAGGKLYVFSREGGDEVTRCLDASTGAELWQDKYEAMGADGPSSGHAGPRSSPAVAKGMVVTMGVRGTVSGLKAATGEKVWRKDDVHGWPNFYTASSPIIVGDLCVVQVGGQNNGAIIAYELASGAEKWRWTGDGSAYASPVLLSAGGASLIIAQTDKNIVGLGAADGKLLWQSPYAGKGMGGYNAATPIVEGSTLIYSGAGRGTRAVKLEKEGEGFAAKELWSNSDKSVQFNSPVLKGGQIFGITQGNEVFCLNSQNGQLLWTAPGGGKRGFGSVIDAGSALMALTPSSQLILFEPSDKEFKQLASYKAADTEIYSYPVLSGNRIYIKDKDSVVLWTVD
jgi:outer membrane protein assembly factor BamB